MAEVMEVVDLRQAAAFETNDLTSTDAILGFNRCKMDNAEGSC